MSNVRQLTGGTKDVNPQFFNIFIEETGDDVTTFRAYPIPVQRLPQGRGAQVMEILKVFWETGELAVNIGNQITFKEVSVILATRRGQTGDELTFADPSVIAYYNKTAAFAWPGTTASFSYHDTEPHCMDLTDGAGHGFLVATDNLFVQISSVGTDNVQTASIKILYRWKNVGLAEYIGIVQSQN